MPINRFWAFSFHLVGSLCVGILVSVLVFLLWYPEPLSAATGVTYIFLIMLMVDVVIGPCITLIVFNQKKPELKRDLLMVLVLQLSAMLYGLYTVYAVRPVYLVFNADRFDLVLANDLTQEKLSKVTERRFQKLPILGPELIAAKKPASSSERQQIMLSALGGGDDLPQMPQYYVDITDAKQQMIERSQPLEVLRSFNPGSLATVDTLVQRFAQSKEMVGFLPLKGKTKDLSVLVSTTSGDVLDVVDLSPWQW